MQASILIAASRSAPALSAAITEGGGFSAIEANWREACALLSGKRPDAIVAITEDASQEDLSALADAAGRLSPYVPMIAAGTWRPLQVNVLPFTASLQDAPEQLRARLRSALRVRGLDAIVQRRASDQPAQRRDAANDADPLDDATVLLLGRGASYPALSMAAGERFGVIGSLSMEAAGRHLNTRDIDGIVLGEGFSPRVVEAFLMVLGEDARFRNLPIVMMAAASGGAAFPDLPNLEISGGPADDVIALALPLIRQQAFEARLARRLKSLDAGGILDARTGLLTAEAFARDFHRVFNSANERNAALSAARFAFASATDRMGYDAARILSRLMRKIDFAVRQADNSIIVVFADTDLAGAHVIARRLASVLRQTMLGASTKHSFAPDVTLATLRSGDTAKSLLSRLSAPPRRAAS
jgi:GGDEF domain-containing protein